MHCRVRRVPDTEWSFQDFNVNLLISYDQSCLKIPEMPYLLLNCYNLFHFIMPYFFYL